MGRDSKHRKRTRKRRRAIQRQENARCTAAGSYSMLETRDPRTRWANLRAARGGHSLSFRGTGVKVPVDLEADEPALEAVASLLSTEDQNLN